MALRQWGVIERSVSSSRGLSLERPVLWLSRLGIVDTWRSMASTRDTLSVACGSLSDVYAISKDRFIIITLVWSGRKLRRHLLYIVSGVF